MVHTQRDRPMRVDTPLGEDALLLQEFSGVEQLSCPFAFRLRMLSNNRSVDCESLLGKAGVVSLEVGSSSVRHVHGIFRSATQLGFEEHMAVYEAELAPWLWFLSLTRDCRIFQDMTVPEIVEAVFRGEGCQDFRFHMVGSYQKREYCVQYRESNLDFVSRLLEEEGIFYFFEHAKDKHTLVLADSPAGVDPCPDQPAARYDPDTPAWQNDGVVLAVERKFKVRSNRFWLNDYDFQKPSFRLDANASSGPLHECYDYPGKYLTREQGERYARLLLEEHQGEADRLRAKTLCRAFRPGYRFQLSGHFRPDLNQSYTLAAVEHEAHSGSFRSGEGEAFRYENQVEAFPSNVVFRPPRVTPKPKVDGPQTAVVAGKPGEEIWVDKYGRVKVQFHWDRLGKYDDGSSCWMRVSQAWAGKGWGAMQMPRVGQEVIVDFLEGDPDRPIITGRVYNAEQMPPYDLPKEQALSGLRSRSTKGGREKNYNEIRFDDKVGAEQLLIHAEKDKLETVENDSTAAIDHDSFLTVKHDCVELVEGNLHATVKGERREKVGGDLSLQVGNDRHEKTGKLFALESGQEIHLKAGQKLVLEAGAQLSIKSAGGFISIDASGITIEGISVQINSGGGPAAEGSGASPKTARLPGTVKEESPPAGTHGRPSPAPAIPSAIAATGIAAALLRSRAKPKAPPVTAAARTKAAVLTALEKIPSKLKDFWDKGKTKEEAFLEFKGGKEKILREVSYDSREKKVEHLEKPKIETTVGVSHTWIAKEGAVKKWGDDKNNIKLGGYEGSLSSGYSYSEGTHSLDVIKGSVSGSALSVQGEKSWGHEAAKVEGSVQVLHGEADLSLGAEWGKKAKEFHAKVGGSVDLVKGEIGGEFKIPIPFTKHALTIGLGAEGQVGASAEAQWGGGWTEKDGFSWGGKAKAGLGLGAGVNFKIGFK